MQSKFPSTMFSMAWKPQTFSFSTFHVGKLAGTFTAILLPGPRSSFKTVIISMP